MPLFSDVFIDATKEGRKIPQEQYLAEGLYQIIDQGQSVIAGYSNDSDGIYSDVPVIVFGDHTRAFKYVDKPLFLGADGVKLLKPTDRNNNVKYLYYALRASRIPDTGYNRHFKWLKEVSISVPPLDRQEEIVSVLDKIEYLLHLHNQQLAKLDKLVKARFLEMFGNPIENEKRWNVKTVSDCYEKILGGGTPSKTHPEYFTGTIPWTSPKDMKSSVIDDTLDHISAEGLNFSTAKLIPKCSVLMVIRSGILKHHLPLAINAVPVAINQDMKAFVPKSDVNYLYLMHFFRAIEGDILSKVRAVTADNIEFSAFVQRQVIVPPFALQEKFAAFARQSDKSRLTINHAIDKLETLKASLMQEYFG